MYNDIYVVNFDFADKQNLKIQKKNILMKKLLETYNFWQFWNNFAKHVFYSI